jgi:signal transduction histidine kinase
MSDTPTPVPDSAPTDPGGHEPASDLAPEELTGAPAWAQRVFDETRAMRRELRAHVLDDDVLRHEIRQQAAHVAEHAHAISGIDKRVHRLERQ